MKNLGQNDDEYPIIWFQPKSDSEESIKIKEKKSIHQFSEIQDLLKFSQSLDMSFLIILPNDLFNEEKLLKEFDSLKDLYCRRLADFEEESVLQGLCDKLPLERSLKVYSFFTRKDFEIEGLVNEEIENRMAKSGVKEVAYYFRKEYILCESHKGKISCQPNTSNQIQIDLSEEDFQKCKEFCIRSLKELSTKRNKEKIKLLYLMNLSESCQDEKESIEYCEKVLLTILCIYGEVHALTASSYRKLAVSYYCLKNFQKALEYYVKALDIRKSVYGESSYMNINLYQGASYCYEELREAQKAIEFMEKSVEIGKSVYGETHSETLKLLLELASVYMNLEEYQKAHECYAQLLELRNSESPKKLAEIAEVHNDFGLMYCKWGKYEESLEHFMKAFEIKVSIYGENHAETRIVVFNVAVGYEYLKDFQKALEYQFKYLKITKSIFGEIDPETQVAYMFIAEMYSNLGDKGKAVQYRAKSLSAKVARQGEMSVEIANSYQELAETYENLGKYQEAFHYNLKSVEIKRVVHGEYHQVTEDAYASLERGYESLEKYQKEFIANKKSLLMRFEEYAKGKFMEGDGNLDSEFLVKQSNLNEANEMVDEEESSSKMNIEPTVSLD